AIVEIRPPVPFSVPGILFQTLVQLGCFRQATFAEDGVTAAAGQISEARQYFMLEKSQPDAFAAAMLTDQVHAIVPVTGADQRKPVGASAEAGHNGPDAMIVQSTGGFRSSRKIIIRILFRLDRAAFKEG